MLRYFLKFYGLSGEQDSLRAYWYHGTYERGRNFGDALTPYIIKKLANKKVIRCSRFCLKEYYLVVGSVLYASSKNAVIWGAGILSRHQKIKKPKKILAVRGPLTRERLLELGYECPEVYGDPALLLPKLYKPKTEKKYDLGIIPHYVDYDLVKNKVDSTSGNILVINLFDPIEKVIDNICSCKRTNSSSLHGVIVSHAYEIPSIWVQFSNKLAGDNSKFMDCFLSVGLSSTYFPPDLTKKIPTIEQLCCLVDKSFLKPNINIEKLMEACPFKQ